MREKITRPDVCGRPCHKFNTVAGRDRRALFAKQDARQGRRTRGQNRKLRSRPNENNRGWHAGHCLRHQTLPQPLSGAPPRRSSFFICTQIDSDGDRRALSSASVNVSRNVPRVRDAIFRLPVPFVALSNDRTRANRLYELEFDKQLEQRGAPKNVCIDERSNTCTATRKRPWVTMIISIGGNNGSDKQRRYFCIERRKVDPQGRIKKIHVGIVPRFCEFDRCIEHKNKISLRSSTLFLTNDIAKIEIKTRRFYLI